MDDKKVNGKNTFKTAEPCLFRGKTGHKVAQGQEKKDFGEETSLVVESLTAVHSLVE